MKKYKYLFTFSVVFMMMFSINTYAGDWIQNENSGWNYVKDDQNFAQGEWINSNEKSYYIDWCGEMLVNNYTPDGYWVGDDGVWNQSVPQRNIETYPSAAVYGWSSEVDSSTFSIYYYDEYSDGYSIADVEEKISILMEDGYISHFYMHYKLVPLGNGCYVLMDDSSIAYYLSVSEDSSTMWVSSSGDTVAYAFIEALIYS